MTYDYGIKNRFMNVASESDPFYGIVPKIITIWHDGKLTKASTDLSSAILWPDDLLDRDSLMLWLDAVAMLGQQDEDTNPFNMVSDAEEVLKGEQSSPLLQDEESVLSRESCSIGANGLVVWYGRDLQITDAQAVIAEKPRFSVYDVHSEKLTHIEDELADTGITKLICGNRDPWILTVRSDGRIVLIDAAEGSFSEVASYSEGEISSVAFTADDSLIAVLTIRGQRDVYDSKTREKIYSAVSPMLQDLMLESGLKLTKLEVWRVNEDTLCLKASEVSASTGSCVLADVGAQLILAEIRNVFAIDVENSCVYCSRGNNQLIRYPLYSAEELIGWSEVDGSDE